MIDERIICAGFGGQGVMTIGKVLTYSGMIEDKHVSWLPSYGPEMRGGTANCHIMVSDTLIGSPIITNDATMVIAMNLPSLIKFEENLIKDANILINSSLITRRATREDVNAYYIPCNDIALELGDIHVANMIMLGAVLAVKDILEESSVFEALTKMFKDEKVGYIPLNKEAIIKGMEYISENYKQ